ncbi:MAG: membrane protein insertase YidC [Alphaproteobacteria bacterium]|nr:membrane protein insertase YidC [Alphaproteobacteria bacterium]
MGDQKNLVIAIALSLAILLGFQFFYELPRVREQAVQQTTTQADPTRPIAPIAPGSAPAPGVAAPGTAAQPLGRPQALAESRRVPLDTPSLRGSIALKGGRLDDVVLKGYRETVDAGSPNIVLLSPAASPTAYYADWGWVAAAGSDVRLPDAETVWTADRDRLTPESPVMLSWDNGQGFSFQRRFAVDNRYMVTVTQRVARAGGAADPVTLHPFELVSRANTPNVLGYYILHEGAYGVFDGKLKELTYSDMKDAKGGVVEVTSTGGWIGFTDKYWMVAAIPDQKESVKARFAHALAGKTDKYQVDVLGAGQALAPGQAVESVSRIFVGAKEVNTLDGYQDQLGIVRFDLAIDWGWFYFLTRPIFFVLDWLAHGLGNFGLAILVLTVGVKGLFFPLANKSYTAMSKMKALQPEMMKLRERFGEDKQRMNQELMGLYKKEKVNPAAGCLPIVVQIPVFFALYKVLFVTIEMRHAPFFGWIRDLSAQDPTTVFNLFGLIPWTPPELMMVGVWPLIMGATMWFQQKLNPQPADPVQAKMFMILPLVFTVMLASFPAGLVIYWAWNNVLSMAQQWAIMYRMGVKAT